MILAILTIRQIRYRDPNVFHGKVDVNRAWHAMLTRASASVSVFGGDVSWAQSNKKWLLDQIRAGVKIRVLCQWPSAKFSLPLSHVRALLEVGAEVKFYAGKPIQLRGLVVDVDADRDAGTALIVTKKSKKRISLEDGQSGTDGDAVYEARRYLPYQDGDYLSVLQELFDSKWASLPDGVILEKLTLDARQLRRILSQIPHYKRISTDDISIETVSISPLYSCCRNVKAPKLAKVTPILGYYQLYDLQPFEACRIEYTGHVGTLLPPILERQEDGKLVIVDGMHRIYQLMTTTDSQEVVCVILENVGELPSVSIPLEDVRISPVKRPRTENFPSYQHEYFRDIKAIYRHLSADVVELPVTPLDSANLAGT